ncbi:MAG: hypothetical protein CW338_01285 [Clostridiales bacterium]|nr:hypothetical protein [Clostridiales bacterium]
MNRDISAWTVPAYEGTCSGKVNYDIGQGIDPEQDVCNDAYMTMISGAGIQDFVSYGKKLIESGYSVSFENDIDGNRFGLYEKEKQSVYVYYTASTGTVRIFDDTVSTVKRSVFSSKRCRLEGETTVLYQIGLPMSEEGTNININGKRINYGMMYVIKLADNSIILIDGGHSMQFDDAQIRQVMDFLEQITSAGKNGKIRIACWYLTHGHDDHFSGFIRLLEKCHDRFILERVMCNIPSVNTNDYPPVAKALRKFYTYIRSWFGTDVMVLKCHTGEKIDIGEVSIEVLYTHEDDVDPSTGLNMEQKGDYNNTGIVSVLMIDGMRFFLSGDINTPVQDILLRNYSEKTLKCDILQVAHHIFNPVSRLYSRVRASWVFIPQSPNGTVRTPDRIETMKVLRQHAGENVFFANEGTTGITAGDGDIRVVYSAPVAGGDYEGWEW